MLQLPCNFGRFAKDLNHGQNRLVSRVGGGRLCCRLIQKKGGMADSVITQVKKGEEPVIKRGMHLFNQLLLLILTLGKERERKRGFLRSLFFCCYPRGEIEGSHMGRSQSPSFSKPRTQSVRLSSPHPPLLFFFIFRCLHKS